MNNDFYIDKKLKDMARSENKEIPKSINKKIEDTLSNLDDNNRIKNKRSLKNIKRGVIAASITLVSFIAFGLTMPSYAKSLPVIGSIFSLLNVDKNFEEYSSDIDITKESNGVKVTINSIVYDSINLAIAYTVETEREMKSEPHILDKDFKVNGKITTFSSGGKGKFINTNKTIYKGIETFNINSSYIPRSVKDEVLLGGNVEVPDKFNLDINIREFLGNIKGEWNFKIPVTSEKVKGRIKEIDLNINLKNIKDGMKLNKLICTPINTVFYGEDISEKNNFYTENMMYFIRDDKGRVILEEGNSLVGNKEKCYFQNQFKKIYDDSESLTVVPIRSKESLKPYIIKVPLNLNGNTDIISGNFNLKITKVEILDDKTKIYFNGKYPTIMRPHNIVDKESGEEFNLISGIQQSDSGEDLMVEFKKLREGREYLIECNDISKNYNIYEEDKFTVSLK